MTQPTFDNIFEDSDLVPHPHSWETAQDAMSKVTRWDQLRKTFLDIRMQTSGEHTLALALLVDSIVRKLNRELTTQMKHEMDLSLLVRATMLHDIPEGILQTDVAFTEKKDAHSLAELRAFDLYTEGKSEEDQREIMLAYLLQFAYEMPDNFPFWAKDIMRKLRKEHHSEVVFFPFIERYDYLMMGFSHFKATGNPGLLITLLEGHMVDFDKAVQELPILALIWSPGLKARCLKVLKR